MSSFRVSFYNELLSSHGQVFKVCQRSVEIRSARTIDRAIAAAKRKFEDEEGVGYWGHRAKTFEVERLGSHAPTLHEDVMRAGKAGRSRHNAHEASPADSADS
jgi:hypothetical protein